MKKICITGKSTGRIRQRLVSLGATPLSCDITKPLEIKKEIERTKPDVIIHAAALTSVDACWKDLERAILVNIRGTNNVCEMASEVLGDGHVVLLSTDHVFDGMKGSYKESDEPNPAKDEHYGLTKFAAEGVVQLYGGKILRLSKAISNQDPDIKSLFGGGLFYAPTFIRRSYCHLDYLSEGIWAYANRFDEMPEILHLAGARVLSFYELTLLIGEISTDVKPREYELEGYAPRPFNCGLDVSLAEKLGLPLFTPEQSVERLFQ